MVNAINLVIIVSELHTTLISAPFHMGESSELRYSRFETSSTATENPNQHAGDENITSSSECVDRNREMCELI
jgi:hypothetical protein